MNSKKQLVSVIIPVFNAEKYLAETIISIKKQTYKNWEIILINDGSTDKSKKVAAPFLSKRIRWIDLEKNSGPAVARNRGIGEANGRYIAFLDADDLWNKNKLKKQIDFMQSKNCAFSFTGYEFADKNGKTNEHKVFVPQTISLNEALKNTTISTITVMFDMKKLSKKDIYMPNLKAEDTATWWKVLRKVKYAYGLNEILSIYRRSNATRSSNKIKAAAKTWELYRKQENINLLKSAYYMLNYGYNAIKRRITVRPTKKENSKIRIIHVVSLKKPKTNGVAKAVENYIKYEKKYAEVELVNLDERITASCKVYTYDEFTKNIQNNTLSVDIVVFNEVYKIKYISLYKELARKKIPYVVIPHGCLTEKAQSIKKIKKRIGNTLFFNRFLKKAAAIQLLNESELKNSKTHNSHNIICGNGVDRIHNQIITRQNTIKITYIGRYSVFTKGLDLLLEAAAIIRDYLKNNNIKIELYGDGDKKDVDIMRTLAENRDVCDIVSINGPVYGKEKDAILRHSTFFIQTSRHEAQPMGIIEALSYGLPCIVTNDTSFGTIVNDNHCGIGVKSDPKSIADAIKDICSNNNTIKLSKNAINLIKNNYLNDNISKATVEEYARIVNMGRR